MTSFSPVLARSCSLGMETLTFLSVPCALMRVPMLRPIEEFAPAAHAVDALHEELQVPGVRDEIQALAVHDEERPLVVAVEVARVGLREPSHVVLVDAAHHRVAALP